MSDAWVRDTGLVGALVALFIAYQGSKPAIILAGVLLAIVMFSPSLLRPIAWVWLMIARALERVAQPVFFGLIFFVIVTPVGLLRRMLRGDSRDRARDVLRPTAFIFKKDIVQPGALERPY